MAEIELDNNKICIPNRLKISTFLAELQKKTKQVIYLINDKEIGIFQSLNEIKRGMWRKLKPNDSICYFYIDPQTQNEYTVFSEECATKLGSFPYEGPTRPHSDRSQTPRPIPSSSQSFQQSTNSSLQQAIPSYQPNNLQQPIPSSYQSNNLQQAIPSSYQTNQQSTFNPTFQQPNPLFQQGMEQFRNNNNRFSSSVTTQQSQPSQPQMNSKTLANMNRISNYTQRHMNQQQSEPQINPWSQQNKEQPFSYPSQTQQFYTHQQYTPNQPQQAPPTPSYVPQNYSTVPVTGPVPGPVSGPVSVTQQQQVLPNQLYNYSGNIHSHVPSQQPFVSTVENVAQSVMTAQSVSKTSNQSTKDPMKYFPPGTRKRNQNVAPKQVETKFSA